MNLLKYISPFFLLLACGATGDEKKSFNQALGYDYAETDNSLLWEITGKGLKQPSFLYGTIHLQDARVFEYGKVVKSVFDTSAAYAMEIDMDHVDAAKMKEKISMDQPLDKVLSPQKFRALDSLMYLRTGGGVGMYKNFKPFFIASTLLKAYEKQDMPFPLDLDFFKKAKKADKKTIGIEKIEEQLSAVDKMSVEEQADMIIEGLKNWDKTGELYGKMVDVYLRQDIAAFSQLMKEDSTLAENFEEALITERNKVMAQRIDSIVQLQPTFNAIGAGHLPGQDGVVELLKQRGYTVKPVKFVFGTPKAKPKEKGTK